MMGFAEIWAKVGRRLGFLGPAEVPDETASGPHPRDRARPRTGYLDHDTFASALMDMHGADPARAPHLHIFSLSDFRTAVGGKWGKLSTLVEVAGDAIIRRHINPEKDIFTRLDAEIACMAMPAASRQEARACVAAIASDLSAHLFGDAVIDGRRPQVVAANMPIDTAITDEGTLDHDAIRGAVAKAGAALIPGGPMAEDGLGAPHRATLAALLPRDEAGGGKKPMAVFAISGGRKERVEPEEKPDWLDEQLQGRGKRAGPLKVFTLERESTEAGPLKTPDWLDEQLAERAKAAKTAPTRMAPESCLTLVWSPTWVSSRRAIGAFHARVIRQDQPHSTPLEGVHAYVGAAPVETLTLDRFIATQAAKELKALYFSQQRIGLTVPFHWMSLAPRWRDCIRIPFEDCPPPARRKLLKIEIFGLSPTMPEAILRSLFDPLEKLGCTVMARLPLGEAEMVSLLGPVKAVGVDLAELGDGDKVGDDELFAKLLHFRTIAHDAGKACYVWGLRRRPLIAKVVGAGFSLVNGPGVMCDISRPQSPKG